MEPSQKLNSLSTTIIPQFLSRVSCLDMLSEPSIKISKTKKICTLGPKSSTVDALLQLIDNGMNVARLNFSHGTHESHGKFVEVVRQANKLRPNRPLAILLDTKGPQIRTGKNLQGKLIQLTKGQMLEITTDYSHLSTSQRISCSYKQLVDSVKPGSQILFSDGQISSTVKSINPQSGIVTVEVQNSGQLGQKKNMCLPGCEVKLPTINDYDEKDIVEFGLKYKVDFIAVSFARYRSDIEQIRKMLAEKDLQYSRRVRIISKVENRQALQNIDQIVDASDGVMVARGDLGMETALEKIILLQKLIVTKCINAGKFVIVATQMVESMQTNPRPTRAQVSDISNAVLDLADATMTSGQTANGQFPSQTVQYMNKISIESERICDYRRILQFRNQGLQNRHEDAFNIVNHSFEKQVDVICLKTEDLELIRFVSAYRPAAFVFVFSENVEGLRNLTTLNYAVYVFRAEEYFKSEGIFKRIREQFGFAERIRILMSEPNGKLFSCHVRQLNLSQS